MHSSPGKDAASTPHSTIPLPWCALNLRFARDSIQMDQRASSELWFASIPLDIESIPSPPRRRSVHRGGLTLRPIVFGSRFLMASAARWSFLTRLLEPATHCSVGLRRTGTSVHHSPRIEAAAKPFEHAALAHDSRANRAV